MGTAVRPASTTPASWDAFPDVDVRPLDAARAGAPSADRLRRTRRLACGDTAEPSTVVIDSRTCPSAPNCIARGVDGGKRIRGVKVSIAVETYGIPRAIDARPANVHDTNGIVPVLRQLAGGGLQGPAIGDLGYRGERLANAAAALGITVSRSPAAATACSSPPRSRGWRSAPSAG